MALIQLKRSSTAGKIPLVADLSEGELALNTVDGALFTKDASNTIIRLSARTKSDIGLANVDNTADVNKPVSTAQQTALNLKANLASPSFIGTPVSPTPVVDTNSTQVATTAFVLSQASAVAPVMDGVAAVGTSLRFARADHVHASDTSRAPLASPSLTGTPSAPTAAPGTNTTQLATTAFVKAATDAVTAGTIDGGTY